MTLAANHNLSRSAAAREPIVLPVVEMEGIDPFFPRKRSTLLFTTAWATDEPVPLPQTFIMQPLHLVAPAVNPRRGIQMSSLHNDSSTRPWGVPNLCKTWSLASALLRVVRVKPQVPQPKPQPISKDVVHGKTMTEGYISCEKFERLLVIQQSISSDY